MAIKLFPDIQQPIKKSRSGFFTLVYGKQSIKQKIVTVLLTRLGERVHLPQFGSRLYELVFEQMDSTFEILANQYVIDALRAWLPEIEVLSVTFTFNDDNSVVVAIQYRITQQIIQNDSVTLILNRDSGFTNQF